MLTDLLPLLRSLEQATGRFHGYLCRWLDLWETPGIGHCESVTGAPASAGSSDRPVTDPEAIGHGH
jgi:hypothetical protein